MMKKSTIYEYEASRNSNGEYTCDAYSEIELEQNGHSGEQFDSSRYWQSKAQSHHQPYDSSMADELFRQSYSSNFLSGKIEYVDQMRRQFDHMRQTMLDQMESYTFVKNIRK